MGKSIALETDAAPARLAAGAAHDLRNLLFVVTGHCHRLQAMATPDHPWTEDLHAIQEAADKCCVLAGQIVSEAKLLEQPARPLDLNAVIQGVEPLLTQLVGDHVHLALALSDNLWPVTANAVQLEQIVMNLAVNARDAMPEGGDLLISTENRTITGVVLGQPSHFVVLSVTDTGTGIDAAVQERMFEPYYTTKSGRGGSGVGLATVRNIALLHAGHIEVATTPGQGTTFRVVFPRAPIPNDQPRVPSRAEPRSDARLRVLVVESEPTARAFLDECLAAAGHDVAVASSGAEAIGWSQTTEAPFDLLLTEIFLPDLSGLHVATRIRTRWPDVRVVFLGDGHDPIGDDTDVPVLVRPFTPDAVSRAIQRALAAGRAV